MPKNECFRYFSSEDLTLLVISYGTYLMFWMPKDKRGVISYILEGTVSQDFLYSVFSPKQLLLVPLEMS